MPPPTLEQFFNEPHVVVYNIINTPLREADGVRDAPAQPFFDRYVVRINEHGGAVYDGDFLVAVIGKLHGLAVHPDHRGRGITKHLIAAWHFANPDYVPAKRSRRTPAGDAAYKAAWRLIVARRAIKEPAPCPKASMCVAILR